MVPTDFQAEVGPKGPAHCSVGWYFRVTLAKSASLPYCKCTTPLGSVRDQPSVEVWTSGKYAKFLQAARNLPEAKCSLSSRECDRCMLQRYQVSISCALHPIQALGRRTDAEFSFRDLVCLRKVDHQAFDIVRTEVI